MSEILSPEEKEPRPAVSGISHTLLTHLAAEKEKLEKLRRRDEQENQEEDPISGA